MRTTRQNLSQNKRNPVATATHRTPGPRQLRTQKAIAKIGMAGSLGSLFVSGFFKFQGAQKLHIYSGFGLLAFSVWHHLLNQPQTKRRL